MIHSATCRIALGTAQLGMPYGIANTTGKPDIEAAGQIVAESWRAGVRYFDTAQAYDESELVLGSALHSVGVARDARVVSKLPPTLQTDNVEEIVRALHVSLDRLGLERLWGVLLHDEKQLDQWNGKLGEALDIARQNGLVGYVGVSVYSTQRALQALQLPGLDLLQVPANLFDRRMRKAGVFARAAAKAVTVFIRSIYLQGLTLFDSQRAKETAPFAVSAVSTLEQFCTFSGIEQKRFAFEYARNISPEAFRIVGAETREQMIENIRMENEPALDSALFHRWDEIWPNDVEELVNPSRWPRPSKANP